MDLVTCKWILMYFFLFEWLIKRQKDRNSSNDEFPIWAWQQKRQSAAHAVRLVWLEIGGKSNWQILWMKHQICNVWWAFNKRNAVLIALNFVFNITTLIIEFNEVWQSDQWHQWLALDTSNLLLHHWKDFLSRIRFLFVYFSLQIQSINTEVLAIFLLLKLQFPFVIVTC